MVGGADPGPEEAVEPEKEQISGVVLLKALYAFVAKLGGRVSVSEEMLSELPEDWADRFSADIVKGPHGQVIYLLSVKKDENVIVVPTPKFLRNRKN